MSQITTGIRLIFSNPFIFQITQNLLSTKKEKKYFSDRYLRVEAGERVLDLGCGTGRVLDLLPDVDYHGYDISSRYIDYARQKYANRGTFSDKILTVDDLESLSQFDIAIISGVLHHLSNDEIKYALGVAHTALKPGGRLIIREPCYIQNQNIIAKFLISRDRGMNVMDAAGYRGFVELFFDKFEMVHHHKKWIPYTYCIFECIK